MVAVIKFGSLVACLKTQSDQAFPVCYWDKHFVNSSFDMQQFFLTAEREKCLFFFLIYQAFSNECETKKSYFSTKTYVVGTQKNRLNETALLSTLNIFKN